MNNLSADHPIRTAQEDLLDRKPLVEQLVGYIDRAPGDDGFVLGVTGPWGSGKSSLLYLLAEHLRERADIIVVRFDPWLFSTADELVVRFFDEVASGLSSARGRAAKKLGRAVRSYGSAVSPGVGVVVGPAGQLLAAPERMAQARKASVADRRNGLRRALAKSHRRIVVLIDDVDRLDPVEVREVLRLVKLVADLPGMVHVLAYDRGRVEASLTKAGHDDGRAYLEKIVQVSVGVPPIARDRLREMMLHWLDRALVHRSLVGWDDAQWAGVLVGGIDRYLSSLRDVWRYLNAAPAALDLTHDEIASMDVLALEAVRVFDPGVYEALPAFADLLTTSDSHLDLFGGRDDRRKRRAAEAAQLIELSARRDATEAILRRLFPVAAEHFGGSARHRDAAAQEQKRVAARPVLMRYLHRALATSEAAAADVDRAVKALADGSTFRELLAGVDDSRLDDLLARVRPRIRENATIDILGCASAALEVTPRLVGQQRQVALDPIRRVRWLVEELVKSEDDAGARASAAAALVKNAPTLSDRRDLLIAFRRPAEPSEESELDLLGDRIYRDLAAELAAAVAAVSPSQLAAERNPLWLVALVAESQGQAAARRRLADQEVLVAVLSETGTELHPLTHGGVRLNTGPLVRAAGEDVRQLLEELASREDLAETLGESLAFALQRALAENG